MNNNTPYTTSTAGCAAGLSIGCTVTAADGWYYDGNTGYAYYILNNSVNSIDTAPCVTPAPVGPSPSPLPTSYQVFLGYAGTAADACAGDITVYDYFWLDASTLSGATKVWTNEARTTLAFPLQYYTDNNVVRYMAKNGTLGINGYC